MTVCSMLLAKKPALKFRDINKIVHISYSVFISLPKKSQTKVELYVWDVIILKQ